MIPATCSGVVSGTKTAASDSDPSPEISESRATTARWRCAVQRADYRQYVSAANTGSVLLLASIA
ncbi:hypothetical protein KCP74_01675 [Salmonella enterica subsp. enterica]|nr:hypothetical protein KCP74_01675 [Salmonella enterica subsp. enterica]